MIPPFIINIFSTKKNITFLFYDLFLTKIKSNENIYKKIWTIGNNNNKKYL
jgi:hypothetical protein